MLVFVVVFVVRAPVAEPNLTRESRFGEQFERAINCRLTDGRIFFFDELI